MSTKWHADGDVHTYFNPYATPYDAYISYMNVMRDLEQRVLGDKQARDRGPGTADRSSKPAVRAKAKAKAPKKVARRKK